MLRGEIMPNIDEVIKGLDICASNIDCSKCPYFKIRFCEVQLKVDASEILKEQKKIMEKMYG